MGLLERQVQHPFQRRAGPVLNGDAADTPGEARAAFETLLPSARSVIIGDDVATGGRGKAGAARLDNAAAEVADFARSIGTLAPDRATVLDAAGAATHSSAAGFDPIFARQIAEVLQHLWSVYRNEGATLGVYPSSFLDVCGSTSAAVIAGALSIIFGDPQVTLADTIVGGAREADRPNQKLSMYNPLANRRFCNVAIFLTESSRTVIQGIAGTKRYTRTQPVLVVGRAVVGEANPPKPSTLFDFGCCCSLVGIPIFGTVAEARAARGADVSVVFVRSRSARDAGPESIEVRVHLIVVIAEGLSGADIVDMVLAAETAGVRLIGHNSPGLISPGDSFACIIPSIVADGRPLVLVSRSGTLTYQLNFELVRHWILELCEPWLWSNTRSQHWRSLRSKVWKE